MKRNKQSTGDFTTNTQVFRLSAAALVIGGICALIAIVLLKLIYLVTNLFFYHRLSLAYITPTHNHLHALVILPPVIGGLVIGLIARYGSEKIRGHGIPEAIEAMLTNESKVHPRVALWKPISAAISIGSGGPFGAEGPIIMTGGSFGSLLSQFLHFSSIERRILLVAGAAGGMSATFSAPISAVLFAVELLVFEFKPRSLVPIALASAVADAIRIAVLGPGPLFGMPSLHHVSWLLLGSAVIIGIVGCMLAVLLTWAIYGVEDLFRKLPLHWMWWPAIGSVIIGVGGLIAPRALGVGYDSISAMLNLHLALETLVALLIVKTIIWVVALGSGTSGGILAPILIIGGSLGAVAGKVMHAPHPGVWALLGMAAIFSGVTRTPFTSIVFPLELTHNLGALLPLLVTSSIATGLSAWMLPRSILTEKIARRGLHMTREYHADPLQMHYCRAIAWIPELVLPADMPVRDAHSQVWSEARARDTWFRVVDEKGKVHGIVSDVELIRAEAANADASIMSCIQRAPTIVDTASAKIGLDTLIALDVDWLQVESETNELVGFVTLHRLLHLRKQQLKEETERRQVYVFSRKRASKSAHTAAPTLPVPEEQKSI